MVNKAVVATEKELSDRTQWVVGVAQTDHWLWDVVVGASKTGWGAGLPNLLPWGKEPEPQAFRMFATCADDQDLPTSSIHASPRFLAT